MAERNEKQAQMPPVWRILLIIGALWFVMLYFLPGTDRQPRAEIAYSEFKEHLRKKKVTEITVREETITGVLREPIQVEEGPVERAHTAFTTVIPAFGDPELMPLLEEHEVTIKAEAETGAGWLGILLIAWLPWILLIGFLIYSSRRLQQRMGGGMFGLGKSKARLYRKNGGGVKFTDVAGLENAKSDLREVIEYLKDPTRFLALGAKLPKGVLLMGPPGTGKTLLARACAGEADVPFFTISGSEFIEVFVGVGASRVRDMFKTAKESAPCILFIDEIDSIGRARGGAAPGGGHEEREQTLNQILSEMDGFSPQESVTVMAATNRPEILDPALVRPGRFDRQITLELPHKQAREEILKIHIRKVPLEPGVDLGAIAVGTAGFSGADLQNLVNEAALLAGRHGKRRVEAEDFEKARDKIILGSERENLMTEKEKEVTAYHEAGHALLAALLPGTDPLKRVTIIPRGRALGATEQIPSEERHHVTRSYLLNRVAIMLGGRVAEKLVFNELTSGAADDLRQVTDLVRRMVCQWGMSRRVGPVTLRKGEEQRFLGNELPQQKDFSERTAQIIDEEILAIVQKMETKAEKTLQQHRERLERLAGALLEKEALDQREIQEILGLSGDARGDRTPETGDGRRSAVGMRREEVEG